MNLIIDTKVLRETLDITSVGLENISQKPISGHYLFRVGEDYCEVLSGHNMGSFGGYARINNLPPTEVKDVVSFTVEGKKLMGFISAVGSGNLNISYEETERKISIVPDKAKTKFNTSGLDVEEAFSFEKDFRKAKNLGKKGSFPADLFDTALDITSPFIGIGHAESGFSLVNVTDTPEGGMIRTAEGKAISVYRSGKISGTFNIRGEKVSVLKGFLKKQEGDITVYEGDASFYFVAETGSYIAVKKVSISFPEMKGIDLFSKDLGFIFSLSKADLKSALNRLKWSLDDDQKRMVFKISSDGVVLNTKNSIGVESSEEISNVQIVTGDTIDFGLNYKHLLSGIEKFSGDILTIYVHKSRQFSFVKILETSDTDNVSQVLILSIMNG